MEIKKLDSTGYILILSLLALLIYAGFLSAKSIDWKILEKLESNALILPPPNIATPSAQTTNP